MPQYRGCLSWDGVKGRGRGGMQRHSGENEEGKNRNKEIKWKTGDCAKEERYERDESLGNLAVGKNMKNK